MSVNPGHPVCMASDGDNSDPERQTLLSGGGVGLLVGSHGYQLPSAATARPTELLPVFKSPKMPLRSTQVVFEISEESPVRLNILDIENETRSFEGPNRSSVKRKDETAARNPSLTDRVDGSGSLSGGKGGTHGMLLLQLQNPLHRTDASHSTPFTSSLHRPMSSVPIDVGADRSLMSPSRETGKRIEFMNGHKRTGNAQSSPENPDIALPFQMNASTADRTGPLSINGNSEKCHVAEAGVPYVPATVNKTRKVQLLRRLRSFPTSKATKKKPETGVGREQPYQVSNPSLTTPYDTKDSAVSGFQGPVITVTSHSEDDLPMDLSYFQEFSAFHFKESITKHDNRKEYQRTTSSQVSSDHGKTTVVIGGGGGGGGGAGSSTSSYLRDQIISFFQPSDNKLAMKLFGNKNALMKEKMRQKAAGNWVIHPCSNFR